MPDWRNSSCAWIGFIAGPLAAIASFVIAYLIDPLNFGARRTRFRSA